MNSFIHMTTATTTSSSSSSPPPLLSNSELKTQYFETKKKEFEAGCLESKHASAAACFSLGEWYQLIAEDYGKAMALYYDNCSKREHSNSCFNLSQMLLSKRTRPEDVEKTFPNINATRDELARAYAKQSCELNRHGQACATYATMLSTGLGGEKDPNKALELLDALCNGDNDARACVQAGAAYLKPAAGGGGVPPRDPRRAFTYMKRACDDLGHPNGCQVLAVMYGRGEEGAVTPDPAKSEEYKEKTRTLLRTSGEKLGKMKVV